jgi:tRNA A-37 threonylcarbamoyl transferase component Bud32
MSVAGPPLADDGVVRGLAERILGSPVHVELLKHKEGRRRTTRIRGARGSAIVKRYASLRAPTVARRVRALAAGPAEPQVPEVLLLAAPLRLLVLSEVPGAPLREALLDGDLDACARAGAALASWHLALADAVTGDFDAHTIERELATLDSRAQVADPSIAGAARSIAAELSAPWECSTVVHRDLYEEQIMLGDRVGLIDLDDAAFGPPELDLGNLAAHVELLAMRSGRSVEPGLDALLDGYRAAAQQVDDALLDRCRRLTRLRLACIHGEGSLLDQAVA